MATLLDTLVPSRFHQFTSPPHLRVSQCLKRKPVIYMAQIANENKTIKSSACLWKKVQVLQVIFLANLTMCLTPVRADQLDIGSPSSPLSDFNSLDFSNQNTALSPCEVCKLVVKSFEKGIAETARGKHEGGDTSWEEKNLKSYADSELRLVDIQERLCEELDNEKGKRECLSLYEDSELEIENWWFKQRDKKVKLHDYLCISKLKRCCPDNNFGPTCQECRSDCNNHGTCDGSGTRRGSGLCRCEPGYQGLHCEQCDEHHFRLATSNDFACLPCDSSCKGCYGPGRNNCTECREGYTKHKLDGCVDVDECADVQRLDICTSNTFCVNTEGSFRCESCHPACEACWDYGPRRCIGCAPGFVENSRGECISEEEWDVNETDKLLTELKLLIDTLKAFLLVFPVMWAARARTLFRLSVCFFAILLWAFVFGPETGHFDHVSFDDPPMARSS